MAVFIAGRTGLQRSQTTACLIELEEALEFFGMAAGPCGSTGVAEAVAVRLGWACADGAATG